MARSHCEAPMIAAQEQQRGEHSDGTALRVVFTVCVIVVDVLAGSGNDRWFCIENDAKFLFHKLWWAMISGRH